MAPIDTVEMLAFNVKLLGKSTKKNILISAGNPSDKERMLPSIKRLLGLNVTLFATPGTNRFLNANNVPNQEIHKVTDNREPNIQTFLREDRLDLVVNILTGQHDYDEASDSNRIRGLSIESGIPLITDVDVAMMTLDMMAKKMHAGAVRPEPLAAPWDMKGAFAQLVTKLGGYACYHAHFDKAYLISLENLRLSMVDMQKKWGLYKYLKENYTHEDLVVRISRAVEKMIEQGVTYCRSMVDADSTVKLLPIQAALEVKRKYRGSIVFEVGVQPLQGVLDEASRRAFVQACELADVIGGLPSKDRPLPERHLDFILSLAKDLGKPLEVHVDQENNPYECETEQLALKVMEHKLEGRVAAIHAISIASKPPFEQDRIIRVMKDAGLKVVICPSAALSMKQLDLNAPLHNSIAPFAKLLEAGIPVHLGVDNIADLFMPLVDGDMWFECRTLMEACRFYDIEKVASVACDKSGFSQTS